MTFSEQEIKPVWDEVARLIGDGVMQLRHRGEALSVETLEKHLARQLADSNDIERRILLGAAINMLKGGMNRQPKRLAIRQKPGGMQAWPLRATMSR